MKKFFIIGLLSMLTIAGFAQESVFTQAVSRYKTAKTASATAVMVKHNNAMTKNKSYEGALYMKDPDKVAITANNGKEQLVMNGNTFTMVMGGRKHVASAKTASQFAAFKAVLLSVLSGGKTNISNVQGVKISQQSGNVIVTMTPAAAKRLMFTSFVLEINKHSGALESLTLNSKRGYTQYKFSNFRFGTSVNDKVFNP